MRRTFTAEEKASVFELWKNGTGFSQIANIWNLYTLNNGGAFMAPEPDDDDDETWVLFNAMNGTGPFLADFL